MRSLIGPLAICASIALYPYSAFAAENWEIVFKERAKFLCEWIDHHSIPTGLSRPHVCVAANDVSPDAAWDEVHQFWSQWSAIDPRGSESGQNNFNDEWDSRQSATRPAVQYPVIQPNAQQGANGNQYAARDAERERAIGVPTTVTAIAVTQQGCMSKEGGLTSFQQQFRCIEGALGAGVRAVDPSDPYLQLYLLSGRKTLDDVLNKRLTNAAARVELQKALMDVTQRYNDAFLAKTLAEVARQKAVQDDARRQREAELENSRLGMESARAEQDQLAARAAVQHCINAATERRQANYRQQTIALARAPYSVRAAQQMQTQPTASDADIRDKCESDPRYYESIVLVPVQPPPAQTTSRCTPDGLGGFTCTSQ
jgi:hypothetical protein